jgi:EF hand
MRSIKLWPASVLAMALILAGAAVAQPPPKDGPRPVFAPPGRPGALGANDVVERIASFDKNKDGKVTKDELPERLHDLIARGDTNKDGALDQDEIKKLPSTPNEAGGRGFGFGGPIRKDVRVESGVVVGPGPGAPGPEADMAGVVEDMKLPGQKKDQALAAVKAHHDNVRKLLEQSRAELMQKMKEILSEEELKDFQAALDRPRGAVFFNVAPPDARRPKR